MIPTDEQMVELVKQKFAHIKECSHTPKYDLSTRGKIRLVCVCGWEYNIEAGGNDA